MTDDAKEGFNNVVLEAGAAGLAVVATDVIGCREAVQDGVTGLLVLSENVAALTTGMQKRENVLRKNLQAGAF